MLSCQIFTWQVPYTCDFLGRKWGAYPSSQHCLCTSCLPMFSRHRLPSLPCQCQDSESATTTENNSFKLSPYSLNLLPLETTMSPHSMKLIQPSTSTMLRHSLKLCYIPLAIINCYKYQQHKLVMSLTKHSMLAQANMKDKKL